MDQRIWNHRMKLNNVSKRIEEGRLTLGFIGGSITDGRPRHNWPEAVISWFVERYPETRIVVENAAIGATGSDSAVFRAERSLIDRGCDLVFIEYAVNDNGELSEKRKRTREGLVRKLLSDGQRDLVFVYTYAQDMYESMISGGVPSTISEFEELAEHYGIGSVWMGLYALEEVKKGRMRFEEWLPDGLHPTSRGSYSYATSVIEFLDDELIGTDLDYHDWDGIRKAAMDKPLDPNHWGKSYSHSLDAVSTKGPWTLRRWLNYDWLEQVLETSAPGSTLSFDYEGRGLLLIFDFGRTSSEFRYRFDGGEWLVENRERPGWAGDEGWYRSSLLGDGLPSGHHTFELEVIHGDRAECKGTNFRLGQIGVIR